MIGVAAAAALAILFSALCLLGLWGVSKRNRHLANSL